MFSTNPDGVVSVRFKEGAAADACMQAMKGRWQGLNPKPQP